MSTVDVSAAAVFHGLGTRTGVCPFGQARRHIETCSWPIERCVKILSKKKDGELPKNHFHNIYSTVGFPLHAL